MAGVLQPLGPQFKIINPDGTPTEYFIRWAQQRQIDIGNGITAEQAQQIIDDWSDGRNIIAGTALNGGGSLFSDVTIDHADSLVTPGTYGDGTNVAQITVDQQGHITAVTDVTISGGGGGGGGLSLISRQVLASDSATIDFSSIPGTYEDLVLTVAGRGTLAANNINLNLRMNGDSTANYDYEWIHWYSTGAGVAQALGQAQIRVANIAGSTAPASRSGTAVIEVPGYARTVFYKNVISNWFNSTGTANFTQGRGAYGGIWRNTDAITQLTLTLDSGNFLAGSVASLYGRA